MGKFNLFAEKKHIYRLLAIAMAEDNNVNNSELSTIVTILMRYFYNNENKGIDIGDYKISKEGISVQIINGTGYVIKTSELTETDNLRIKCSCKEVDMSIDCEGLNLLFESEKKENTDIKDFYEKCIRCTEIVLECLDELKDPNDTAAKSIFMNVDSLDSADMKRELNEMMYIIKSDNSVMDREREAFRIVCKIFKIRHSVGVWKELYNIPKDEYLKEPQKGFLPLFTRREKMNVNDFSTIWHSIDFYEIKGPIVQGTCHILQRNFTKNKEFMYISDKKWSWVAIWSFALTALYLYFDVSRSSMAWIDSVKNCLFELLPDKKSYIYIISIIAVITTCYVLYHNIKNIIIRNLGKQKSNKVGFILKHFSWVLKKNLATICKWGTSLILATFFFCCYKDLIMPVVLMTMMLSIEWLIFMRQEYHGKKHEVKGNTSILIVLVAAAMLIDVCVGVIELVRDREVDFIHFVSKFSSALILGCLCFFAGKFLDMYRIQQHTDVSKMGECVENLKKHIK